MKAGMLGHHLASGLVLFNVYVCLLAYEDIA